MQKMLWAYCNDVGGYNKFSEYLALTVSNAEIALTKRGVKDLTHPVALGLSQHRAILTDDVVLREGSLKIQVIPIRKAFAPGGRGAADSVVTCDG